MKQQNKTLLKRAITKSWQISAALCLLLTIASCEQEYPIYSGENYIQFGSPLKYQDKESYEYIDTVKSKSFAYDKLSLTQDTMYFDLYTVGGAKDYDRPFVLEQEQIADTVNCIPGKHYIAFDDAEMTKHYVLKAGEVHMLVPIIFLRDETLKENVFALKVCLRANEHFQLGDSNFAWRKAYCTDLLVKPTAWTSMIGYFVGEYSQVKHRFLIDATGKKWDDDFFAEIMSSPSGIYDLMYWAGAGKKALEEYNKEHPDSPLVDENGKPVIIP